MSGKSPSSHVVVFGRPGSGKSSLAERLAAEHGFRLIRTGELLREAVRRRDPLGLEVESELRAGQLVPDATVEQLLVRTLGTPGADRWLFDGFPRTLGQVPILQGLERTRGFRIDCYLDIAVGSDTATGRMAGRRVCPACGATYHVVNKPPRVDETCDLDGVRLVRRADDAPTVIAERQRIYELHTLPILDYYRTHVPERFRAVDGERAFDRVYLEVLGALGLPGPGTPKS